MSYIAWRKENEDTVRGIIRSRGLGSLPAWSDKETSKFASTVIDPLTDKMVNGDAMGVIEFSCVFGEYLLEEYNVSPIDIELFTQVIIKAFMKEMTNRTNRTVDKIKDVMNDKKLDDEKGR